MVRSGSDVDSWPRTGFSRRLGDVTRAGLSERFSEPSCFARRLQDIESDTGYDTLRRTFNGALARVSQTAVYDTYDRLRPRADGSCERTLAGLKAARTQRRQDVRAVESPGAAGPGRDGAPRHLSVQLCRELGILRRWPMHRRVRVGEDLDLRRFIVRYVDDGTRGLQILRELDEAVVDQVGTASAPPRTAPSGTRTRCSISSSPSRRQSGYRSASASRRRSATPPSGPTSRSARGRGPCGQGCPTLRGPPPRSSVRPPPSQPHRRRR